MNRRNFLGALLGFAVLPGATTYKRIWRRQRGLLIPEVITISDISSPSREMLEFHEQILKYVVRSIAIDGEAFLVNGQPVNTESNWSHGHSTLTLRS